MAINYFPSIELADEEGLLAVGGDLNVETLLKAYKSGIFPWPVAGENTLMWFAPPRRALLFLDKFSPPKSLKKLLSKHDYTFRINTNFEKVIEYCSKKNSRTKLQGTWITPAMMQAYIKLHHSGYCHSIECYQDQELIGGLYGVAIGAMFAGESMFYLRDNASKLCLCYLADYLIKHGAEWIDCQQLTPLLASFGANEVSREHFMDLLNLAIKQDLKLFTQQL